MMLPLLGALVAALFMAGVGDATASGGRQSISYSVRFDPRHGAGAQFGAIPAGLDQAQFALPRTENLETNKNLRPSRSTSTALPAVASGSGWSRVPSPNPVVPTGQLDAVSCSGSSACMAVGTYVDGSGLGASLVERWDGTSWSQIPSTNQPGAAVTDLTGVSCTSATACTAVGWYVDGSGTRHGLAEGWNGTTWSLEAVPDPPGAEGVNLNFVACSSASSCVTVGGYNSSGVEVTLAERWDGRTWTVQSTPNPSGSQYFSFLAGVSCTSSTACTAVGGSDVGALAERWNGTKWSIQSTPSPGQFPQLYSVSCTSALACIGVGVYTDPSTGNALPLAEQWNGTKWSTQSIPSPTGSQNSFLNGVSCLPTAACTADGGSDGSTLAEQWNGHSWSIKASPTPTGNGGAQFNGISCSTATTCVGVGNGSDASGALITFGEGWDGSHWELQATVNPPGDGGAKLQGVSCKSPSACIAVGGTVSSSNNSVGTFAEQWNGTAWSIQPTPNPPAAAGSDLNAVSCTSTSACIAVGATVDNSNNSVGTLAEQWNGTTWTIQPTPAAAGLGSALNAISCSSPNSCTAVGNTATSPLAEHWDGASWTIQPTPAPANVQNSGFGGVSCTSASSCIAVGGTFDSSGNLAGTFAEQWNGTAWSMLPTPTASTPGYNMQAISCTSSSNCTGVGQTDTGLLAERWNGTTWTEQSVITPAGTEGNGDTFTGVSCSSPSACTATGVVYPSQQTITERWNGSSWIVQNTPALPGTYDNDNPAVSCPTSSACMAVGGYADDGAHATLAEQWTGGNSTTSCVVPNVKGETLKAARRTIGRASCSLGHVTRRYSATVKTGHVLSQKPKPTLTEPANTKITLTVSRGRKRH
jgi:hypothetical protein